jgi:Peptidase_C39 like family
MFKCFSIAFLLPFVFFAGCRTATIPVKNTFSHFVGLDNFSAFTRSQNEDGETVLLSPQIKSEIPWDGLIVSWNAQAPPGAFLKVEASAISASHATKFYNLANWSADNKAFPRSSFRNQKDADGLVRTDTLILTHPADVVQIRVTLGGVDRGRPTLKFLGASFSNSKVQPATLPSDYAARGKVVFTPERSQHGYPGASGWCSPTSLSMALARWSDILNRPDMNLSVPLVATNVFDASYDGTGNWAFNTAYAGSFSGMRSYVTRFDDLAEVEDWIAAGIPVILSTRWDWLRPGRLPDAAGHLIVCIGFTENGDVIVNDPAAHLDRGQTVRQIYKREDVLHSWSHSHHAVYLVYPTTAKIPENRYGHW